MDLIELQEIARERAGVPKADADSRLHGRRLPLVGC